jgi:hypothetical protein
LCRGVALALSANAIESAIESSAAINIVSFFNTDNSIHQKRSGRVNGLFRFAFHVNDEPVAACACNGYRIRLVS